jgi:dimeric dUTPase (all-alpha-NTP-PPase superfamily)
METYSYDEAHTATMSLVVPKTTLTSVNKCFSYWKSAGLKENNTPHNR